MIFNEQKGEPNIVHGECSILIQLERKPSNIIIIHVCYQADCELTNYDICHTMYLKLTCIHGSLGLDTCLGYFHIEHSVEIDHIQL